ncbi:9251_t:CDS:2 [Entrophospora sp. SA101]|nr:9251_t:CDS:2 [Entrophospora sp. SA101]
MAKLEQELASTVSELEHLKSEAISKPIVGGDDRKNITKSDNISLGSTDLNRPEISDETSISKINKDNMLDISIKPNASEVMPQIPIGAMRPIMWFVVLRRTWNISRLKEPLLRNKKHDQLLDKWIGH